MEVIGPCILWTGTIDKEGYGRIGRGSYAHKVAWEEKYGPVPEGLELDHKCRVRACVNTDHMEPVTHLVNMSRGYWATKTHCINGHEYTPDNLLKNNRNPHWRICKTCKYGRIRKRRASGRR